MGKLLKKEIGITLISLVVTIVILLILAGITINLVLSDKGIFEKTEEASEEHEKGAAREKLELKLADMVIEKNTNKDYNENNYLTEQLENSGFNVDGEDINLVTVDGWQFEIDRSVPKIVTDLGKENVEEITADMVSFTPEDTSWQVDNVKEALDYFYNN